MVTQKAISARIYNFILRRIEQTCTVSRNRILNDGAMLYLDLQDVKQAYHAESDPDARAEILHRFLRRWLPGVAFEKDP